MSSIDLNIIQKGAASDFKWTAGPGRITSADLGCIGEQRTDNGGALNALPTPFARFFVFKEAFRRVLEEKNNPGKSRKEAGRAYERLVSNCLDVFELLYNKQYHENVWKSSGREIKVKEWNVSSDLQNLKKNVPVLGRAVESYIKDDLGENRLFFIILVDNKTGKEYLLATSSPMTGFITPPDLDMEKVAGSGREMSFAGDGYRNLDLRRKHSGRYFENIVLFGDRSADFKNYMYNALFADGSLVEGRYREIRDYIQAFRNDPDIRTDWQPGRMSDILSVDGNALVVNGLRIQTDNDIDAVNYFSDYILRLPYRISSENFKTLTYVNEKADRDYDYVLPLSVQALEAIGNGMLEVRCQEKNRKVDINIRHNEREFTKTYRDLGEAGMENDGIIIPMQSSGINFDIALFPNVLSRICKENNYFKVLVSVSDDNERKTFGVDRIDLDFYRVEDKGYVRIDEATNASFGYGCRPAVVRSRQSEEVECGTKYYEVFNTAFDVILVRMLVDAGKDGKECSFALFPDWDRAQESDKSFDYAIDLGTSNTYISRREHKEMKEPQQLVMARPVVSYMHDKVDNRQRNPVSCWEENIPDRFKSGFKTEFLPPFFDGTIYKFPVRTVLCRTGENSSGLRLFDNSNIAFFYGKMKSLPNQTVITDIKWSENETYLRVFIRELLLIIKADILQENGNLSQSGIIWFRPLSFREEERRTFERIWAEEAENILCLRKPEDQICCYSESEAPYYYFSTGDYYKNNESVAILDIGGGSTDFVYFHKGEPVLANSVHFGCDIIWGNGFDKFRNSRKNGIYKAYKDILGKGFKGEGWTEDYRELNELNEQMMTSQDYGSQDIINFWIASDNLTKMSARLRSDFSYVFAYHYTAVIYYMMSTLRIYGQPCPGSITFSGNGSRYIDQYLTSSADLLEKITQMIASYVFGDGAGKIQLILRDKRKEATCYGGLYHKKGVNEPETVVYYGNGRRSFYENVEELSEAFSGSVKMEVVNEVMKMNGIYMEVLKELIRSEGRKNIDVAAVEAVLKSSISDVLESKFRTEILEKYSKIEQYNDTLFFIPVTDILFRLTNCKEVK